MKLTFFSIKNYRSIIDAELDLQTATILIGPNNEGKSNVLHGLNTCLNLLSTESILRFSSGLKIRFDRNLYEWSVDYPVSRQTKHTNGESIFQLHFQLSPTEKLDFQRVTKSKLNGVLPIELRFGPSLYASFKVLKQGKGGTALSSKLREICHFISENLEFAYIPAVRTASSSLDVVNELVSRELRQLEKNPRYAELVAEIESLQKPVFDTIAGKLTQSLKEFLGDSLKAVSLSISERSKYRVYGRSCQITIDDGTPTKLERKGDGVQSLVAISLMAGAIQDSEKDTDIILLLEEPESHLHPKAIHQLSDVLDEMKMDNQLILTTHCPLLVNRANVTSNLIVSGNKASPATSLSELRDVLGVRASDNLRHAALVVVVEGFEDEVAFAALLGHYSVKIKNYISAGAIAFQQLGGASKLPYSLALLQSSLCNYFVILDDDREGRLGYAEAEKSKLIAYDSAVFAKRPDLSESEFEDLIKPEIYSNHFMEKYSVNVMQRPFDSKKKWSERIRLGMTKAGKSNATGEAWPERDEYVDKTEIAKLVASDPANALHSAGVDLMLSLVAAIERKMQFLSTGVPALIPPK